MNQEKRKITYYKSILEKLNREIEILRNIPIRENYFLILGGGKFGTVALDYAIKEDIQYILIIDKNEESFKRLFEKYRNIRYIHDINEYFSIFSSLFQNNAVKDQNQSPIIYFWRTKIDYFPLFLFFGIPNKIIPTIPVHVIAFLIKSLLHFPLSNIKFFYEKIVDSKDSKELDLNYSGIFENLQTNNQHSELLDASIPSEIFERLLKFINPEVILSADSTTGTILLSYAKSNEICPINCIGPPDYCPHFKRKKPKTITNIAQDLISIHKERGWVFESHQIQAGLGGFIGLDFKKKIISCLLKISENFSQYVMDSNLKLLEMKEENRIFIATTCNCHGIINVFLI